MDLNFVRPLLLNGLLSSHNARLLLVSQLQEDICTTSQHRTRNGCRTPPKQ